MLFLVISNPRPERPSGAARTRKKFWTWLKPGQAAKQCLMVYARPGRGAVAILDVRSHEELHELLNGWAELVPAQFDVYPPIDPAAAQRYLNRT
ncbi:MAG: hypothetical protein FJY43_11610 [Betaproteobacteria bacterium]|nr:hypothetical protein [Betaproteobacteria bacterium]